MVYFDFRRKGEGVVEGYQSVPVRWDFSSARNGISSSLGGNHRRKQRYFYSTNNQMNHFRFAFAIMMFATSRLIAAIHFVATNGSYSAAKSAEFKR